MLQSTNGYDPDDCAIDLDTWEMYFQGVLEKNPDVAQGFVRVHFYLLTAMESSPEGLTQAKKSLKEVIEWAYTFGDAHKAVLKLFLLYVEGRLTVPEEPQRLITGAVARGIEDAKKSRKLKTFVKRRQLDCVAENENQTASRTESHHTNKRRIGLWPRYWRKQRAAPGILFISTVVSTR